MTPEMPFPAGDVGVPYDIGWLLLYKALLFATGLGAVYAAARFLAAHTGERWACLAGTCAVAAGVAWTLWLHRPPVNPLLSSLPLLVLGLAVGSRVRLGRAGPPRPAQTRASAALKGKWAVGGAVFSAVALLVALRTWPAEPRRPVVVEGAQCRFRGGPGAYTRVFEGVVRNTTGRHFRRVHVTFRMAGGGRYGVTLGPLRPGQAYPFRKVYPRYPEAWGDDTGRVAGVEATAEGAW